MDRPEPAKGHIFFEDGLGSFRGFRGFPRFYEVGGGVERG